ncbi:YhjD/YihY/BrkB family envelope integrity protein [Corynebacterium spheniscorum]|uniref:Membrane protein n=1 Tax=Corynebacterium spheniscorum TaxID=185761 RepID=A0A1I2PSN1_9CORY|nr:YhjD/YihY/BrkB family envelope integrity protein [Corynebacterium spheniscorum]KAA8723410.1 inner membrane protein YhjD [Corynebacterium spheniscorum]SFG18630.1 membrane protein [Corynebacterium spheniscorum]
MATSTQSDRKRTDEYGIERTTADDPGFVDKLRDKWGWFDHVMLMQERYSTMGGNQYAAGITYFSVLAIFPILMLVFAAVGFFLASRPETLQSIQDQIAGSVDGKLQDVINEVLDTAIEQRSAVAGIGALTTLWSGLGWMNNLRYGVSKMWRLDPTEGNFLKKKAMDLLGLIGLLLSMIVAFAVTAIGASGLTQKLLVMVGLDHVPGIRLITFLVALAVGILANYLVMFWLIKFLPRTKVPLKSAAKAALIGAVAFELIKQLGSVFASNALSNPAGATFGPIIALMVVMYLVWRVVLYCSAWAATTEESLQKTKLPAPPPAVIRVRAAAPKAGLVQDLKTLVSGR